MDKNIDSSELVEPGKEWICLIGKNNVDTLVHKTKFKKFPGDKMVIEGKSYIVISSEGDRSCMIAVGNKHIKGYNKGIRRDYWGWSNDKLNELSVTFKR